MKKSLLLSLLILFSFSVFSQTPIDKALRSITIQAAQSHINFLARDELEGREAGFHGGRIAREYIISRLTELNITPLDSAYVQHFEAFRVDNQKKGKWQVDSDSIDLIQKSTHQKLAMSNILACIYGKKKDEYVIVGAHYDHLGIDPYLHGDKIYNGADDNASGVSAVLQIAKAFVESGVQPQRTVVFAFWDGEEKGLLGSKYFVQNYSHLSQVKGYLNFDMIGRNNKPEQPQHVVCFYTESHPTFGRWLEIDLIKYNLDLEPEIRPWDKPIGGSDNGPFALHNIPIIWYHTDGHPDYHKPTDHSEHINWEKVVEITKASFLNMWRMANEDIF